METIRFDLSNPLGGFKPMNAVNNGPHHKRHATDQYRSNLELYRKANIPFARNHEAAFYPAYGGEFTVDISAIFPNFDADVDDPLSYDFACTDEYIAITLLAGTETFYRLGQKMEHEIKKHHTLPPKDFEKWAKICEHIIRHYNEGWADGFHYNIRYWEIWNEADIDPDDSTNKRTWGGTERQFFQFYEVAAKHLKQCFPDRKIGGPALAGNLEWAERFLAYAAEKSIPMDFFSWHRYCTTPEKMMEKNRKIRALLDQYGYADTENILDEWNYVRGWTEAYVYTLEQIAGLKGASFALACMTEGQKSSLDMMMYYDARPRCAFNGLFAPFTLKPLKGYYPFLWYGMLYGLQEVRAETQPTHVYSLCGIDESGKTLTLLTHYDEDDDAAPQTVKLDFGKSATYEIYTLDKDHDGTRTCETDTPTFTLPVHTCLLIKEI